MLELRSRLIPRHLMATAATLAVVAFAPMAQAQDKTVTALMHAGVRILDPMLTTAHITRDHGYMIYDTLVAIDAEGNPAPQMAEWAVSEDGLTYTFALRDGLTFHDGAPVTAADAVASLKRWGARDTAAASAMKVTASINATDDKTLVWQLESPFPLLLSVLSKPSSLPAFVLPERIAQTASDTAITEYVGSGPFRMVVDEFQPGVKIVYDKFEEYVPRNEPANGLAGGKTVNIDRVVWVTMPDQQTAINALMTGEIDMIENTQVDLLPIVATSPDLVSELRSPIGYNGIIRMNFLHPPFNNLAIRRAAMTAISQDDIMATMIGNRDYYSVCGAVFGCGTLLGDETGAESLTSGGDKAKARQMLADAGYDGTPVVVLHPTDLGQISTVAVVVADALRQGGFNVDMQSMDWQTLVSRRVNQAPPSEGGWNLMTTFASVMESNTPLVHPLLPATGLAGPFGWADDPELEALRAEYISASGVEAQKEAARKVQARVLDQVLLIPFGSYAPVQSRNAKISNQVPMPMPVFWNLELAD